MATAPLSTRSLSQAPALAGPVEVSNKKAARTGRLLFVIDERYAAFSTASATGGWKGSS